MDLKNYHKLILKNALTRTYVHEKKNTIFINDKFDHGSHVSIVVSANIVMVSEKCERLAMTPDMFTAMCSFSSFSRL